MDFTSYITQEFSLLTKEKHPLEYKLINNVREGISSRVSVFPVMIGPTFLAKNPVSFGLIFVTSKYCF